MSGVAAMTVPAVSAVHEHVHQQTQDERQVDERAKHVSSVLGKKERTGNNEKA